MTGVIPLFLNYGIYMNKTRMLLMNVKNNFGGGVKWA